MLVNDLNRVKERVKYAPFVKVHTRGHHQFVEKMLRYLCEQRTDSTGEAWTLVSKIMADLDFTREDVYTELMKANDEDLVKILKTLEPGPYGIFSATITARAHILL